MPRISAANIAEHVARQEAAVFDAAVRLFVERGYHEVSLGDIAAEVGLKRNSLYRYFPDKAHILVRWFRLELPHQVARSEELLTGDDPPLDRLRRWTIAQLDYARTPEHTLVAALVDVAPQLDPETRAELADSHRGLMVPLTGVLAELGVPVDERSGVVDLLGGLVLAAARREVSVGEEEGTKQRLLAAVAGLVGVTSS